MTKREPEDRLSKSAAMPATEYGLSNQRPFPGNLPEPPTHDFQDHLAAEMLGGTSRSINKEKLIESLQSPAVWVEMVGKDKVSLEVMSIPNDQAMRIVHDILPKALELYLNKSRDYDGNVMSQINLGPKACIPDMQRKFGKLVNAIWWDKPLQFEQVDEILMDLLGHILIILDEMNRA
jgi:hypothetical protein